MFISSQFAKHFLQGILALIFILFALLMIHAWNEILEGRDQSACDLKCVQALPFRNTEIILGMAKLPFIAKSPMEVRADLGFLLIQERKVRKILVSGGKGKPGIDSEAKSLRKMLESRGVLSTVISEEDQSSTTYENLKFSLEILKKIHSENEPIYIVTHTYHAYRAGFIAKALGLNAQVLGASDQGMTRFAIIAAFRESLAVILTWIKLGMNSLFISA